MRLNKPIVGMAATPDGGGYWLVASDGGIFSYGDAGLPRFDGLAGVELARGGHGGRPGRRGLLAGGRGRRDLRLRHAGFFGSAGSLRLNKPVVGMASVPDGGGYWLVAADGGIFSYGDARFFGSTGSIVLNQPIVGMSSS